MVELGLGLDNPVGQGAAENDFDMYEGEDAEPYYPIQNSLREDKDLSAVDEIVFVAVDETGNPVITLHLTDPDSQISVDYDPDEDSPTILNTIFVHLLPTDTDGHVGVLNHEIAVTLLGKRTVVFPAIVGSVHTFTVAKSWTWNEETHAERLSRETEPAKSTLMGVTHDPSSKPRRIRVFEQPKPKRFLNVKEADK